MQVMTNKMLDAAIAYTDKGWYVLPVSNKVPVTPHGVKDATRDKKQLEEWFNEWPEAQIAIATGTISGVDVLDVDGPFCPTQSKYHVRTPRGHHLYFKAKNQSNAVGIMPSVDVRGNGGYVVAPPSPGYFLEQEIFPLQEWPDLSPVTTPRTTAFGPGISKGGRDDALYRYCCYLRSQGANETQIREAAIIRNATYLPPLSDLEVERKVQQAMKYPPGTQNTLSQQTQPSIGSFFIEDVETAVEEKTEWLVEPYIPKGKITFLEGDPGIGKSTIATLWGSQQPGTVLWWTREEDTGTLKRRAKANKVPKLLRIKDDLVFPQDVQKLANAIQETKATLIVIDPLVSCFGELNPNVSQDVRKALDPVSALLQDTGTSLLAIRHWNKKTDQRMLYRGDGSTSLTGQVRVVTALVEMEGRRILCQPKNSHIDEPNRPIREFTLDGLTASISPFQANLTLDDIERYITTPISMQPRGGRRPGTGGSIPILQRRIFNELKDQSNE